MTNNELAALAIKKENTPELGQYWQKRYEKFLNNKVFILSDKTTALLDQKNSIDAPATPYGYLNLPIFVGKNNIVDEVMLQNCIETSVRFLDSVLDMIDFTHAAAEIINQNRKIGLGVVNFEEYMKLRGNTNKVEEIDYIGEIISSSSYRASEALAEEKGACENWNNIKLLIRPKSFEYWYNSENGEIISGLDVAEEYTATNLVASNFEIIPRRNSHILIYPNDLEWQIWSDRDDSSIITNVANNTINESKTEMPIISTGQDDGGDYLPSFEQEIPIVESNKEEFIANEIDETVEVSNQNIINEGNTTIEGLPLINPLSSLQQKISSWFTVDQNQPDIPQNPAGLNEQKSVEINTDNFVPTPIRKSEVVIQEVIKEVPVEVIREVEIIKEIPVEIIKNVEVIREINKVMKLQAVILSSDGKYVLLDKYNKLPAVDYKVDSDPEDAITKGLKELYLVDVDFIEICSVDLFKDDFYVVYQTKIHNAEQNNSKLHFGTIDELITEEDQVALSKSMDRIRRWQESAKIKAQKLAQDFIKKSDKNIDESNLAMVRELQTKIQQLMNEKLNSDSNNRLEIQNLKEKIVELESLQAMDEEELLSELQPHKIIEESSDIVSTPVQTIEDEQEETSVYVEEIPELNASPINIIPSINIEQDSTNLPNINQPTFINMSNNNQKQTNDEDTFRTSRDKMFMPTLEIETKLGVPIVVKTVQDESDIDNVSISTKPTNNTLNTLMRLKKINR
jgi:Ribonucleotide reductase, barrel domain